MALTIKQKVIKFLTPILLPVVKIYWKIFKPETFGVKVIVENKSKFIWIKSDYGYRSISFPGGKIDKGETPEQAARRETKEEVGIDLIELKLVGSLLSTQEGKKDNIYIFHGKTISNKIEIDDFEIAEADWFTKENLPAFSPLSRKIWDIFITQNF